MPDAGQIVGGRYRLLRPLGEGGMASVWAAEHLTMGNTVALKIITPELLKHDVAIARFNREARAAAKLRSPYVVQIFDHDIDPKVGPYIAMELMEGESLADRIEHDGTLDPTALVRIMLQVSKGLMRAHAAGIVHRDLKPDNIFLTVDEDDGEIAKVLDFGVAKADSPLTLQGGAKGKTVEGTLLGTLNYMSPEQAQGREVNHLTDLWAMGVIAFEALVGRRPFDEEAPGALVLQICAYPMPVPSAMRPEVPAGFDEWFAKACNRDPSGRFQTAQELARALADTCDAEQLTMDDIVSFPVDRPLSAESITSPTIPRPAAIPRNEPAPVSMATSKKRRVLEIVETIPPPSPESTDQGLQLVPSDAPEDVVVELGELDLAIEQEAAAAPAPRPMLKLDSKRAPKLDSKAAPKLDSKRAPKLDSKRAPKLDSKRAPKPEPEYFLMHGRDTVGPVSMEAIRKGYSRGHVTGDTLLWTRAWTVWKRAAEVLSSLPEPPKRTPVPDGLLLVGPTCTAPAHAPAAPRTTTAGAAAPVSAVRTSPGSDRIPEATFWVTDGSVTVGPVRASVLLWRESWTRWVSLADSMKEFESVKPAPAGLLRNRPGIECVGMKAAPPPTAPPTVAPNRQGQSK